MRGVKQMGRWTRLKWRLSKSRERRFIMDTESVQKETIVLATSSQKRAEMNRYCESKMVWCCAVRSLLVENGMNMLVTAIEWTCVVKEPKSIGTDGPLPAAKGARAHRGFPRKRGLMILTRGAVRLVAGHQPRWLVLLEHQQTLKSSAELRQRSYLSDSRASRSKQHPRSTICGGQNKSGNNGN